MGHVHPAEDRSRDDRAPVVGAERAGLEDPADPAEADTAGEPLAPLAGQFAALTTALVDASTVAEALRQIVSAGLRVVPAAELASITLREPDGSLHTPTETDPVATSLDQVQFRCGEGPCLTASDPSGPAEAVSRDLADDVQWPRFATAAAERGLRSVCSVALLADTQPERWSGALNLYSRQPGGFTRQDQHAALLLASHASLALAQARSVEDAALQEAQLRCAIDSRDVIGQAKGILMARRGYTADEAFDLLRRASQDLNVKLIDLADTLTRRHTELDGHGS